MFYLTLILLLYRFYSNCDLTERSLSATCNLLTCCMYIYCFHTDLLFSIKKTRFRITFESLCLHDASANTDLCLFKWWQHVGYKENTFSDHQMPYALNVCQIQRQNQVIGSKKKRPQWHVQIMGQQCKIVCHSTVWKGLFYSTHGRQITQWNSMLKDIAFKINLIIFVSFDFVGIDLICALMRHSVCKALSYLCHNIKKLSGMEWFAYRSMFVSCEGVWHHRYWNS